MCMEAPAAEDLCHTISMICDFLIQRAAFFYHWMQQSDAAVPCRVTGVVYVSAISALTLSVLGR